MSNNSFLYTNIITNNTYTICSRPCILHSIIVNTAAAGAITITDGSDAVAVLKASITEGTYYYDIELKTSLIVVTAAAASDITVTYKPSA